ncbi:hypothetical protein [Umezawaea sp. Da 62-37]|uniref:hypothetical protein n=1 Tax=Umezawaea sp. Da 62-37 TaxID=3075927 RepID=UPI0028F7393F|nr:hypothetical protein [Umezawaea sp. Da 62-37]WNV87896.1 hypothetical protein RM788_06320 [Umezawaea sp. Da 62-37]
MRKIVILCCALFGLLAVSPPAQAETATDRAERLCTGATTEVRSERDNNKLNVGVCALVDGKNFRAETIADCYFYKGFGWFADQPCDLSVQFLIEFRKKDTTIQSNKSAVLAVSKEDGLGLTATMKSAVACPKGTTSIVVTAGVSAQQYWTDNGDAEKPYGLVRHTIERNC